MHYFLCILFLLFCTALSAPAAYQRDDTLGLSGTDSAILGFGDFDSDVSTDVFVQPLTSDNSLVKVMRWDTTSQSFESIPASSTKILNGQHELTIIPTDFNNDGKLDYLAVVHDESGLYNLTLFLHDPDDNSLSVAQSYDLPQVLTQPLVIPFGSSMRPSLIAQTEEGRRFFENTGFGFEDKPFSSLLSDFETLSISPLLDLPHFFADVNGDCLADLLLFTQADDDEHPDSKFKMEIYTMSTDHDETLFEPSHTLILPPGSGVPALIDMNRDGVPDLVIPVKDEENGQDFIEIWYNSQKLLCSDLRLDIRSTKDCRVSTDLCSVDNFYKFGADRKNASRDLSHRIKIPLGTPLAPLMTPSNPTGSLLKAGDFDSNGFMDVLVPFLDEDNNVYYNVLKNVACTDELALAGCTFADDNEHQRSLKFVDEYDLSALTSIKNVEKIAFFDFSHRGKNGIIIQQKSGDFSQLVTLRSTISQSSFFLSVGASNGVCHQWCGRGNRLPNPKPFGVNSVGNTFKFRLLDFDGTIIVHGETTYSQHSHSSLSTPSTLFGLGPIATYIDQLWLGVCNGRHSDDRDFVGSWMTLMPNAKLFVFNFPLSEPNLWQLLMYIRPSDNVVFVAYGIVALLCVLGLIIGLFKLKEMKADQLEKERMGQHGLLI
ncbi:hypothetical protein RCL1_000887 [Eukaryota sp. TZLM3-RCL]